jgi:hypothetical protein
MRRKLSVVIAVAGGLLLALVAPTWAHHAFDAEFDRKKPIKLQGIVKRVEWINPHSWITIEVKKPDGTVERWEVESGPPNAMFRRGLSRDTLTVGTEVVVQGYQSMDANKKRANGGSITFTDGRSIFLGGSNPDDPENRR